MCIGCVPLNRKALKPQRLQRTRKHARRRREICAVVRISTRVYAFAPCARLFNASGSRYFSLSNKLNKNILFIFQNPIDLQAAATFMIKSQEAA